MFSNLEKIVDEIYAMSEINNYLTEQLHNLVHEQRQNILDKSFSIIDNLSTSDEYEESTVTVTYSQQEDESFKIGSLHADELTNLEKSTEDSKINDYRILEFCLSHYKKFPVHHSSKEDLPFGMNLSDRSDNPNSCVIYANNGYGKSSLYSALYYAFVGNCAFPNEEIHYAKNDIDPSIKIRTKTKLINVMGKNMASNNDFHQAFFCAEQDIQSINSSSDELDDYIVKQLGYGEARSFLKILNDIIRKAEKMPVIQNVSSDEQMAKQANNLRMELKKCQNGILNFSDEIKDFTSDKKPVIDTLIATLHKPIVFDYNHKKDREKKGNFPKKTRRVNDLNRSAETIISQLKSEYEELNKVLPNCFLFKEYYLSIIRKFESTLLSKRNETHFEKLRNVFDCLDQIDIVTIENGFTYYINRVKQLNEIGQGNAEDQIKWLFEETAKNNELANRLDRINKQENEVDDYKKLKLLEPELKVFVSEFSRILNGRIEEMLKPLVNTIERLMNDFNSYNDEIKVSSINGHLYVKYIMKSEDEKKISFEPFEYLNSFRQKIFALSLKISLAFAIMKNKSFVFPLILDDVFYAEDFSNRNNVCEYISHIFECYEKHCGFLNKNLQIIFMTHDNVIFDSVYKGIALKQPNCIQGMMFDYHEVDCNDMIISEHLNQNYYNLYVRKR